MQNNRGWLFKFFRDNNLRYYNSKIKTPAYLDLNTFFPEYKILEEIQINDYTKKIIVEI